MEALIKVALAASLLMAAVPAAESEGAEDQALLPPIVAEFKAAYESGDLEQIAALYTDDGILATTDDVFDMYWSGRVPQGQLDTEGSEFKRRGSIHRGEMVITDAVQLGRTAAFDWDWEDFASGTALLHLRNDEIVVAILAVSEVYIRPAT